MLLFDISKGTYCTKKNMILVTVNIEKKYALQGLCFNCLLPGMTNVKILNFVNILKI